MSSERELAEAEVEALVLMGELPAVRVDAVASLIAKSEIKLSKEAFYRFILVAISLGVLKIDLDSKGHPQANLTAKGTKLIEA